MKIYKFGEIVLTQFPFVSGAGEKQRPALVLKDTLDNDVIIAVITSKIHKTIFDFKINDWQASRLLFPSTVRLHKLLTKEKSTIIGILGKLTDNDLKKIRLIVKKLWNNL